MKWTTCNMYLGTNCDNLVKNNLGVDRIRMGLKKNGYNWEYY